VLKPGRWRWKSQDWKEAHGEFESERHPAPPATPASTRDVRPSRVVQQGLRTPTVPSFGNCCIRGIHGPACGSAFMRQLRGRAVLSFAAT
jgi:hypothetical protein